MRINIMIDELNNFKLWMIFFVYTFCVSAFVQMILLPYILPGLHFGSGLLNSSFDSIAFHRIAIDSANKIHTQGWSAWQLRPAGQSPAGIASFFYLLIPDPRILIPVSAALHATAALILVNLMNLFVKNKTKAVLCVLPFLIFPSNLLWTAQWHRDIFSVLGIVLVLQGVVLLSGQESYKAKGWLLIDFYSIVFCIAGFLFIWIARPYLLAIIGPFIALVFSLLFLAFLIRLVRREVSWQRTLFILLSMMMIIFTMAQAKTHLSETDFREDALGISAVQPVAEKPLAEEKAPPAVAKNNVSVRADTAPVMENAPAVQPIAEKPLTEEKTPPVVAKEDIHAKADTASIPKVPTITADYYIEHHWKMSPWLPISIDNKAYYLARTRGGYRFTAPEAKSNIDREIGFGSVKDILVYLPRAIQIALLAPFPNQWMREGSYPVNSLMRKISAFEMITVYFALIFLPYAIWHWRKRVETWIIFTFCLYMMTVHGLVVCNIGTLYRMRYVYITTLVALGIAGFLALLDNLKVKKRDD